MAVVADSAVVGPLVSVGSVAPDFTLPNQDGQAVSLSSFRGSKAVLLVFFPFAFSGICTGEFGAVSDSVDTFQNDQVQILGISTDTKPALKTWAAYQGYRFPLLSDFWPHGGVARQYGVFFDQVGTALRGTFLIGVDGIVSFAEANQPGQPRDQEAWKRAIAALPA